MLTIKYEKQGSKMNNDDESVQNTWRRSSRCIGGDCLEVLIVADGVRIRDSKDPGTGTLRLAPSVWVDLLQRVREGGLDRG
jgi:hypothetical protein